MEAEYYTDKSIAIFGDTKPWKENLKAMGASFNKYLQGPQGKRAGWIIPKSKESEIMQFIDDAENGRINPLPVQPKSPRLAQVYPSTPKIPLPAKPSVPRPLSPKSSAKNTLVPQPLIIKPSTKKPAAPKQKKEIQPNFFVGDDGLNYQIITYTVIAPSLGQRVNILVEDAIVEYQVTEIEKHSPPFDSIKLAPIEDLTEEARAVIINGVWQIDHMNDVHSLIFL